MSLGDERVDFNFDQMVRVDELADLDHRCSRVDVGEELAVGSSEFFPAADVGHVHSSPDDILETCSEFFQGGVDLVQDVNGLPIRIADFHCGAVIIRRSGA